jgi:hypothetical protein
MSSRVSKFNDLREILQAANRALGPLKSAEAGHRSDGLGDVDRLAMASCASTSSATQAVSLRSVRGPRPTR